MNKIYKKQSELKYARVNVYDNQIKFIIDTGCSIDLIDKETFNKLCKQGIQIKKEDIRQNSSGK